MQIEVFEFVLLFLFATGQSQTPTCGIVRDSAGFVVNGKLSTRGSWPWIVSIHKAKSDSYICGGVFLGSHLVVTVSFKNFPNETFISNSINPPTRLLIAFKLKEKRKKGHLRT